jgi:hypothetical protein
VQKKKALDFQLTGLRDKKQAFSLTSEKIDSYWGNMQKIKKF